MIARPLPLVLAVLLGTAPGLVALPSHAQVAGPVASPELALFEYGILCYYDDDNPGVPMPFEEVSAVFNDDGLFDEVRAHETLKVPGIPGIVFGVVSALSEAEAFGVTSIITHTNTSGRATEDRLDLSFDDTVEIDAWSIDQINPGTFGTFRFQALRGTETIYDVTLNVIAPEEYTGSYPECLTAPTR